MKKTICTLLIIIQLFMLTNVSAAVGDVIGYACVTDITATICGAQIPSFNVNGDTYIIAEDLADYGFNVVWHPEDKLIAISRNTDVCDIYTSYVKPYVSPSEIGLPAYEILATDINAAVNGFYLGSQLNGKQVNAYNINGRTIIPFDILGIFGNVRWNPDKREISLSVIGINNVGGGTRTATTITGEVEEKIAQITAMSEELVANDYPTAELTPFAQYMYSTTDAILVEVYGYLKHHLSSIELAVIDEFMAQFQSETQQEMANTKAEYAGLPYLDGMVYVTGAIYNGAQIDTLLAFIQ